MRNERCGYETNPTTFHNAAQFLPYIMVQIDCKSRHHSGLSKLSTQYIKLIIQRIEIINGLLLILRMKNFGAMYEWIVKKSLPRVD